MQDAFAFKVMQHRLPPAASWLLWALKALGPSTIAELVEPSPYSQRSVYDGAEAALATNLVLQSQGVFRLNCDENSQSDENQLSENKQNLQNPEISQDEKPQNDENCENSSRVLSSSEVKPLKEKKESEKSSLQLSNLDNSRDLRASENRTITDNSKNHEKDEKGGNPLLFQYCQDVLHLDAPLIARIFKLGDGNTVKLIAVLDAYRWHHVEGAGTPIGNVISWISSTLRNGVNRKPPVAFTFATWAREREAAELATVADPAKARAFEATTKQLAAQMRGDEIQRDAFTRSNEGHRARMDRLKLLIDSAEYERRFQTWRAQYVWARENKA